MESYFMTDAWCFFDALQDSLIDQQKKGALEQVKCSSWKDLEKFLTY